MFIDFQDLANIAVLGVVFSLILALLGSVPYTMSVMIFVLLNRHRHLRKHEMKKDLALLEQSIRNYWDMEFSGTRFPEKMFNACMMLAYGHADGMSPSALAHLLHSYVMHLKETRKR